MSPEKRNSQDPHRSGMVLSRPCVPPNPARLLRGPGGRAAGWRRRKGLTRGMCSRASRRGRQSCWRRWSGAHATLRGGAAIPRGQRRRLPCFLSVAAGPYGGRGRGGQRKRLPPWKGHAPRACHKGGALGCARGSPRVSTHPTTAGLAVPSGGPRARSTRVSTVDERIIQRGPCFSVELGGERRPAESRTGPAGLSRDRKHKINRRNNL
jgi:hypothetical protein